MGQGTALMAKLMPGAKISINGPLGKPFEPPADPATRVILVGGGIGLAPFLHLARQWPKQGKYDLALLAGARSKKDFVFMKRFGEADELVGTAVWLCSDAAKFVTGIVVPVDGGFSTYSGV